MVTIRRSSLILLSVTLSYTSSLGLKADMRKAAENLFITASEPRLWQQRRESYRTTAFLQKERPRDGNTNPSD